MRPTAPATLLALLGLLGLAACDSSSEPDTPTAEQSAIDAPSDGELQSKRVVIDGELAMADIKALGEHVEGLAEIHSAKIEVEKRGDGPTHVTMTVAGRDLPTDAELAAEVRGFEGLGEAAVDVEAADAPASMINTDKLVEASEDEHKTPEQVKQEVIAKLRADGVEGDIDVQVIDADGERRVEVHVEQHEEQAE